MARSISGRQAPVSLFPMFNILVATLGVLVFIQIAVVVVSLGIGKSIVFVPNASGEVILDKPVYLEWTDHVLTVAESGESIDVPFDLSDPGTWDDLWVDFDVIFSGTDAGAVFDRLRVEENEEHLIVIVRPSGFDNFWVLRGYLESRGVDFGYEPLDEGVKFRGRS